MSSFLCCARAQIAAGKPLLSLILSESKSPSSSHLVQGVHRDAAKVKVRRTTHGRTGRVGECVASAACVASRCARCWHRGRLVPGKHVQNGLQRTIAHVGAAPRKRSAKHMAVTDGRLPWQRRPYLLPRLAAQHALRAGHSHEFGDQRSFSPGEAFRAG